MTKRPMLKVDRFNLVRLIFSERNKVYVSICELLNLQLQILLTYLQGVA